MASRSFLSLSTRYLRLPSQATFFSLYQGGDAFLSLRLHTPGYNSHNALFPSGSVAVSSPPKKALMVGWAARTKPVVKALWKVSTALRKGEGSVIVAPKNSSQRMGESGGRRPSLAGRLMYVDWK